MPIDLKAFLKQMISAPGLSGFEAPIRGLIQEAWTPLADEIAVSRLGSLHALRRGAAPAPHPSILLAAHMDAIGFIVSGIADGFIRFTSIGGIDPRVLPGQSVTVYGREPLHGVIVQPPARLLPPHAREATIPMEYLWIDVGMPPEDLPRLVRVGDVVAYAQHPLETAEDTLCGHSLDNRASVAVITHCLELLANRPHAWDVWAVATVQEENTMAGAYTSVFQLQPSLAVAIDVTFAASPGSPAHQAHPLGKGPALGWGPNVHPALFSAFKRLAEQQEITFSLEAMPRHSGTDAYAMQVVAEGLPTMVISVPLRYMHTPVEMIAMKDITRAGRLLAEFIAQMPPDFMDSLAWDD
jgi:tetrahedral aminopeptidase